MRDAPLILTAAMLLLAPAAAQTSPVGVSAGATLVQFQERDRTLIATRDANGDGRISAAEWSANTKGKPARPKAFARIDTNGDGQLDRVELDAASSKRFVRLDANNDGRVTREERRARRQATGTTSE